MTAADVIGTTLTLFGQILCGPGMYAIMKASLTVWSLLGTFILLKTKYNFLQLIGCAWIIFGLGVSGADSFEQGTKVLFGAIMCLIGMVFHSAVYWLNEFFHSKYEVNMQLMCGFSGFFGVCAYALYLCCYPLPCYKTVIIQPVIDANGVPYQIFLLYLLLTAVDYLHMFTQYTGVPRVGSVTMSIIKAMSLALLFVFSSILFC